MSDFTININTIVKQDEIAKLLSQLQEVIQSAIGLSSALGMDL